MKGNGNAAPSERPILFSRPMVRAILEGRKTQTRRVINPQIPHIDGIKISWDGDRAFAMGSFYRCPYGKPGDSLWVRETWQPIWATDEMPPRGLRDPQGWAISYPATDSLKEYYDERKSNITTACKPGIHMPRWASRITLEITNVRVERLQEMSLEDAQSEGVEMNQVEHANAYWREETLRHFITAWDVLNGKRGYSWESNPFVWVITFNRIKPTIAPELARAASNTNAS